MNTSQNSKSPKQWLEHFREQDSRPRDPEFRRIWEGASIYIFGHYRRGFFDGDNLFGRKLTAKESKLVELFERFLARQGIKLFREWMLYGRLASADGKYFYILNGLCFSKYFNIDITREYFSKESHARSDYYTKYIEDILKWFLEKEIELIK